MKGESYGQKQPQLGMVDHHGRYELIAVTDCGNWGCREKHCGRAASSATVALDTLVTSWS